MSARTGTVVARYKRHCLVETPDGERVSCQLQRRSLKAVVGDAVRWTADSGTSGTLTEIVERDSELRRIDSRGRAEVVAANLTQLVVVVAPDPAPDWFLVDRYLAAAEIGGFVALIVFNKTELVAALPAELDGYRSLGYPVRATSASRRRGLPQLAEALRGQRSTMIGQSGVGKSSLLNALLGDRVQAVGELSEKSGQGRHTTTTAVLYRLPGGGELIDSPGVRDYSPYIADPRQVADGFAEFRSLVASCRFQDCRHLAEPDCAVKAAVAGRRVAERRYLSYRRLYELTESLQAGRF